MAALMEMFEKIFANFNLDGASAVFAAIKDFFAKIFAPKVEE